MNTEELLNRVNSFREDVNRLEAEFFHKIVVDSGPNFKIEKDAIGDNFRGIKFLLRKIEEELI